jgi:transposase
MHIQLSQVRSEVTGATGQRIMRAIVAGERTPRALAALRNPRCQKEADAVAMALTGTWREAPLCVLTPALALCDCSTVQRSACDTQIARTFSVITPRFEPAPHAPGPAEATPPPRRTPHSHSKHAPAVNTRAHILRLTGVDLVAVHGISDAMAQAMLAETVTDMHKWLEDTHCGSWLGLAPKNDLSGGKVLKSRTMKHRHRAAQGFRMAAQSVLRADGALGAFSRRLQGRRGPAQALVATAHKIARTVYHLLKDRVPYHDIGAAE